MNANNKIKEIVQSSITVKQHVLSSEPLIDSIAEIVRICTMAFQNDKKLLFCGNGGSAADAQHIAAEFSGRFYKDREPLDAEALHVNTSYLTAVGNDYSFEQIYSRLVKAKGKQGDVLIAISTSGNSTNIIEAVKTAKSLGMTTIGFTGETGGKLKDLCDVMICVPSKDTPRIQESHILIGHILCEMTENNLANH